MTDEQALPRAAAPFAWPQPPPPQTKQQHDVFSVLMTAAHRGNGNGNSSTNTNSSGMTIRSHRNKRPRTLPDTGHATTPSSRQSSPSLSIFLPCPAGCGRHVAQQQINHHLDRVCERIRVTLDPERRAHNGTRIGSGSRSRSGATGPSLHQQQQKEQHDSRTFNTLQARAAKESTNDMNDMNDCCNPIDETTITTNKCTQQSTIAIDRTHAHDEGHDNAHRNHSVAQADRTRPLSFSPSNSSPQRRGPHPHDDNNETSTVIASGDISVQRQHSPSHEDANLNTGTGELDMWGIAKPARADLGDDAINADTTSPPKDTETALPGIACANILLQNTQTTVLPERGLQADEDQCIHLHDILSKQTDHSVPGITERMESAIIGQNNEASQTPSTSSNANSSSNNIFHVMMQQSKARYYGKQNNQADPALLSASRPTSRARPASDEPRHCIVFSLHTDLSVSMMAAPTRIAQTQLDLLPIQERERQEEAFPAWLASVTVQDASPVGTQDSSPVLILLQSFVPTIAEQGQDQAAAVAVAVTPPGDGPLPTTDDAPGQLYHRRFVQHHTTRLSIPVLKSMLQKSIRRRKPMPAVRLAMELADRALPDLLRRLPIIVVEDSTLHAELPFLVWIMMAQSKGFQLSANHSENIASSTAGNSNRSNIPVANINPIDRIRVMKKLFEVVYQVAACQWVDRPEADTMEEAEQCDSNPLSLRRLFFSSSFTTSLRTADARVWMGASPDFEGRVTHAKLEKDQASPDMVDSRSIVSHLPDSNDRNRCLVASLWIRAAYGGMPCDVLMLRQFARVWYWRLFRLDPFSSNNDIQQESYMDQSRCCSPHTEQSTTMPVSSTWHDIPLAVHTSTMLTSQQRVGSLFSLSSSSEPNRGDNYKKLTGYAIRCLTITDACIEGVDFHCSPILHHLMNDTLFVGVCLDLWLLSQSGGGGAAWTQCTMNNRIESQRREWLERILKQCIWTYSAGLNRRRPLLDYFGCQHLPQQQQQQDVQMRVNVKSDPAAGEYKILWREWIEPRVKEYQMNYVQQRLHAYSH